MKVPIRKGDPLKILNTPDTDLSSLTIYFDEIGDHDNLSAEKRDELFGILNKLSPHRLIINQKRNPPPFPVNAKKPKRCKCEYPQVITGRSGHGPHCPVDIECNQVVSEIASHLYKMVISIAGAFVGYGVELNDLVQQGNGGLLVGIWKFDNTLGHEVSTYVTNWIRQAITRTIADCGTTIRVPVHVRDRYLKYLKLTDELDKDHFEAAELLGVAPDTMEESLQMIYQAQTVSIDSMFDDSGSDKPFLVDSYGFLPDEGPQPEEQVVLSQLAEVLGEVLACLPPRKGKIIKLRFGLIDGKKHTLQEVADRFGVTRERIRQLEIEALKTLRHPRYSRRLRGFLDG